MFKLSVEKLNKNYGKRVIFSSVNIKIFKAGFYVLAGRNGSGKSTLFKILKGIETQDDGIIEIYADGNMKLDIRENVSYCPANPILFDSLSALENVKIISNDDKSIDYYFELFELNGLRNKNAKKLSAGERIRVCIVRTILENKPIVLLDEITKHLDRRLRNIVLKELCILSKERIILYTTHYSSDIPENVDGIMKFDSSKLSYDSEIEINDVVLKDSIVNHKILKKVLNWNLNYIFLLILLMFITVVSVSLTYLTEAEYKSLYRHSLGEESYVLGYNGRQIVEKNIFSEEFVNSSDDNIYSSYSVQNLFNISAFEFERGSEVFKCDIDRFNIVNIYDGLKLDDNQIVLSDFTFYNLKFNGLILEENEKKYFTFYGKIIEIVDVFKTSFSDCSNMFEIPNGITSEEMKTSIGLNEEKFEKMLEEYDIYFDYTYMYKQAYCNQNTFSSIVRLRRENTLGNFYLDDIYVNENFSYDLIAGRMPEANNEVVLTKQLFIQLIKNKHYTIEKDLNEYLGEEFEYVIKSNNGKNEQVISFIVVGFTSNIIEITDITGVETQVTLYSGIIDYDGSISNEIISWEGYYIDNETIGFTYDISKEFAEKLYDNGYILINNNTLSLLDTYKIRDQFSGLFKNVIIILSAISVIILGLSAVLEYRFIKSNLYVIDYLSINKKTVVKMYLVKTIFILCVYSFLLLLSCIIASNLISSYCSKVLNINTLLFDTNYVLIIVVVLLFVILKMMEKKLLFSVEKKG